MELPGPIWVREFGVSSAAVMTATTITNPIDVVKIYMQMQTNRTSLSMLTSKASSSAPPGMVGTAVAMVQAEGTRSLFRGLLPAVSRAGLYGGLRLGLYGPIKESLAHRRADRSLTLTDKMLAGCSSGTFAALVSNPIDLVKVRLQAPPQGSPAGAPQGPTQVAAAIVRQEGLSGLWRGASPSMMRAAVLTATQCATYDESKRIVRRVQARLTGADHAASDSFLTHLSAAMVSGVVTNTVTAPIDLIKTRLFLQQEAASSNTLWAPVRCGLDIVSREGVLGLFKGWTASYVRLGPQTAIIFVVVEQLRALAGLDAL